MRFNISILNYSWQDYESENFLGVEIIYNSLRDLLSTPCTLLSLSSSSTVVFTLRVGGISVGLCDFLYCCVCKQLLHAFVSKCDFFYEGKVKIHYYVSHIFDSHVMCPCMET
jgi:hypothetical protein